MRKQGHADTEIAAPKRDPIPHAINQNFPSQIGIAVDPKAVEPMHTSFANPVPHTGYEPSTEDGPGSNRDVKRSGSQGSH
jgi:hypothetical protein